MEFKRYEKELRFKAREKGYSEEEIENILKYSKKLYDNNLPVIQDIQHLSLLMGVDIRYLYKVSNSQRLFYRTFSIKKKNGDPRKIKEPLPTLKKVQRWIVNEILNNLKPSVYSKAYRQGMSIKDNARFHQNQEKVICLDIVDYFGSIKEFSIYEFFCKIGYKNDLSVMLAKLCCLDGALPQGSPTSPALSNLITIELDIDMAQLAKELSTSNNSVRYTRYADDITFSGNGINVAELMKNATKILGKNKFQINHNKTRVLGRNNRQMVTGIVVNEKMQVSKKKRKEIRMIMYYISKHGLSGHLSALDISIPKIEYLNSLLGSINYILFINKNDEEFIKYKKQVYDILDVLTTED